jgi:Fur family ferric uptake transcriptional regulator
MDAALRDRWLARAYTRIAAAGLRSGAARTRVVELLAREAQCLIGVQAIVDRLRAEGSPGSQASVYRVLDELQGLGLVTRSVDAHGVSRYEIADPDGHHHHLVDEETGAVEPFEDPALEQAIEDAALRAGIELTGHEILLRGRRRPTGSA